MMMSFASADRLSGQLLAFSAMYFLWSIQNWYEKSRSILFYAALYSLLTA
jgi:hypothetical protein